MKLTVVFLVAVCVILGSILMLARQVDIRQHRIVQLECALAQAHAEADTLEAMLEEDR